MNRQKIILGGTTLLLIGLMALLLFHLRDFQHLGEPGVKSRPIAGQLKREILMPETIPGFTSVILTNSEAVLAEHLPADTSFRALAYVASDHYYMEVNSVLMGRDRSSLHAPQICLTGQGWVLDKSQPDVENIPMSRPVPYQLPVNKLLSTKQYKDDQGNVQNLRGIFLFWFVDADSLTTSEWKRKLWIVPHDLLTTGIFDRWAYISCFSSCLPGQEAVTYDRMKRAMADLIPEFQLVPPAPK